MVPRFKLLSILSLLTWILHPLSSALAEPFAYLGSFGSDKVSVLDTATNLIVDTVSVDSPVGVAVNPSGTLLYVTSGLSNILSVIDTSNNLVVATVAVGAEPGGVAVNASGTRVYVANRLANSVSVIDASTNLVVATVPVGQFPVGVAVNALGTRVYVANEDGNSVSVIDGSTNTVIATVPAGNNGRVVVNPAGTRAFVGGAFSSSVVVIDTATNLVIDNIPVQFNSIGVAVNGTGSRLYATNAGSGTVSVIDTSTDLVVATVPVGAFPTDLAVNEPGTRVYVLNENDGTVSIIDTATNLVIATLPVGGGVIAVGKFVGPGDLCGDDTITGDEQCDLGMAAIDSCCTSACQLAAASTICRPSMDDDCDPAEICSGTSPTCPADVTQPNGTSCDDGNACTQTDTCQGGACAGSNSVVCTVLDQCHDVGTCNTTTGVCSNPNKTNGTPCTDNSVCTAGDTCQAGACQPGMPLDCDDHDPCTADSCDAISGCGHTSVGGGCDPSRSREEMVPTSGGTITTPDGSISIAIPSGALGTPTEITIKGGMTDSNFDLGAGTRTVSVVDFEPSGISFLHPVTITIAWPDANNDGRVDGVTPILRETSLRVWHNGTAITGQCGNAIHRPGSCTTACCDPSANTWTFQASSFSEFAVAEPGCGPISSSKLVVAKLTTPPGDDTLTFKGTFSLAPSGLAEFDPLADGIDLTLNDAVGTVLDAAIPGGAYDRVLRRGWKVNGPRTHWTYTNTGTTLIGGVKKLSITKSTRTAGLMSFTVMGKDGSYPLTPAVEAQLASEEGPCFQASFPGPTSPVCSYNANHSTLRCQ